MALPLLIVSSHSECGPQQIWLLARTLDEAGKNRQKHESKKTTQRPEI